MPTGQRKGIDGLGIAQQVEVVLIGGIASRGAVDNAHANLLNPLLVRLGWVQPAKLLGHLRRGLQAHGDFLFRGDIHMLHLLRHRVGRLGAKVAEQRDDDHSAGDEYPAHGQPTASTRITTLIHK